MYILHKDLYVLIILKDRKETYDKFCKIIWPPGEGIFSRRGGREDGVENGVEEKEKMCEAKRTEKQMDR